ALALAQLAVVEAKGRRRQSDDSPIGYEPTPRLDGRAVHSFVVMSYKMTFINADQVAVTEPLRIAVDPVPHAEQRLRIGTAARAAAAGSRWRTRASPQGARASRGRSVRGRVPAPLSAFPGGPRPIA